MYLKFSRNRTWPQRKPADLTDYDLPGGTLVQFGFQPKSASVNKRVPKPLLDAAKERAKLRGIPYSRLIRHVMEREVFRPGKPQG